MSSGFDCHRTISLQRGRIPDPLRWTGITPTNIIRVNQYFKHVLTWGIWCIWKKQSYVRQNEKRYATGPWLIYCNVLYFRFLLSNQVDKLQLWDRKAVSWWSQWVCVSCASQILSSTPGSGKVGGVGWLPVEIDPTAYWIRQSTAHLPSLFLSVDNEKLYQAVKCVRWMSKS